MIASAGKVSAATFLSRILGLLREQVTAFLFGAGDAVDAFKSAYRIPNLLRDLFAEGALSAGFVPIFSEKLRLSGREAALRFAGLVFGALTAVLAAVVLMLMALTPQIAGIIAGGFTEVAGKMQDTILLGRVMMPFLLLISLSALMMGILNSLGRFGIPALAPAMLNLGMIAAALGLSGYVDPPILSLAIGVLVGGATQFLLQYLYLFKLGFRFAPLLNVFNRDLLRMLLLILPMTIGLAANQINVAVVTRIASVDSGAVSYLDYAFRLLHLPLGLFAVAIATVTLPRLSSEAAVGDHARFGNIHSRALRLGLFLGLPAAVVMVLLSEDICRLVYQYGRFTGEDTQATAQALAFYSLGLPFFALARITVPAFYALKDTKLPALVSMVSVLINVVLCLQLRHWLGFSGLALAAAMSGLVNITLLVILLRRKVRIPEDRDTITVVARLAVATALMGLTIYLLHRPIIFELPQLGPNFLGNLAILLVLAATVYLGSCLLFGVKEPREFLDLLRRKL
jgi:putative peptidoglycan lipid II flippase